MLKLIGRFVSSFIANAAALYLAERFVPGFAVSLVWRDFLYAALVLTLINIFLRPILKLILAPVILLTLGLGLILVNMLALYALEFFSAKVIIAGLGPLFYGSIVIGFVNFVFHWFVKSS